jgi:hypothetical protein
VADTATESVDIQEVDVVLRTNIVTCILVVTKIGYHK